MISEGEAAKYPFLRDAVGLVETLHLKVDDLAAPSYRRILNRGEERVSEAILRGVVGLGRGDSLTELLSFPVAIMFTTVIGERFLDRRYALAEAVRVYRLLRDEGAARIALMARGEFNWDVRLVQRELDGQIYRFQLHFVDYLRNAAAFHEDKWKLVNRVMRNGYVLLTRVEAARLMQVEVEGLIRGRVSKHGRIALPKLLQERVDKVRKLFEENRASIGGEELPSEAVVDAFPPCIRHAFEGLMSGRRASHMERFALTSFLINIGMDLERIVQLFVSVTDFDEQLTRYQIEHIAGLRGSRTKYTPPTCATLRTHGVCHSPDRLCKRIKHPLAYYRIKVRDLKREQGEKPAG